MIMSPDIFMKIQSWIKDDCVEKFYWTKEWRSIRKLALLRDKYECQTCKKEGRYSKAEMVHHKKTLREAPHLALSLDNLESECNYCHNLLHPEKLKKENLISDLISEQW